MKLAESILELFYPSTCPGCGNHTSLKICGVKMYTAILESPYAEFFFDEVSLRLLYAL